MSAREQLAVFPSQPAQNERAFLPRDARVRHPRVHHVVAGTVLADAFQQKILVEIRPFLRDLVTQTPRIELLLHARDGGKRRDQVAVQKLLAFPRHAQDKHARHEERPARRIELAEHLVRLPPVHRHEPRHRQIRRNVDEPRREAVVLHLAELVERRRAIREQRGNAVLRVLKNLVLFAQQVAVAQEAGRRVGENRAFPAKEIARVRIVLESVDSRVQQRPERIERRHLRRVRRERHVPEFRKISRHVETFPYSSETSLEVDDLGVFRRYRPPRLLKNADFQNDLGIVATE